MLQDIGKDEMLTEDNFRPDSSQFVYKLRQMQDTMALACDVTVAMTP